MVVVIQCSQAIINRPVCLRVECVGRVFWGWLCYSVLYLRVDWNGMFVRSVQLETDMIFYI